MLRHLYPALRLTPLVLLALAALPASAEDMPTIQLVIKGGRLFPEKLDVPAGVRFRLSVRNDGPGAAEFESLELKKELVLGPGVTRTLVFHPLKAGSYKFFDEFHADTAQGLIVAR